MDHANDMKHQANRASPGKPGQIDLRHAHRTRCGWRYKEDFSLKQQGYQSNMMKLQKDGAAKAAPSFWYPYLT